MLRCNSCGHFLAGDASLCAACGTPRSGVFNPPSTLREPRQARRIDRRLVSLPAKIAWISIFSAGFALMSSQANYGDAVVGLHVDSRFLGHVGSYFMASMPFAVIPRSAGLIFGLGVLAARAFLG